MGQPYIGEIRMFAGHFAPLGWATCDGQLLSISEYEPLFSLIGTTYGGDGENNFALPNLAARAPLHKSSQSGQTYALGQEGGTSEVTLTTGQIPVHNHLVATASTNETRFPDNGFPATATSSQTGVRAYYEPLDPNVNMSPQILQPSGGSQPHYNMQPFLAITYIIALEGIFPPRS